MSAGEKVLRAILIYLFLIAILRIVGKRDLGQANTLDLVVLLLVANAVQNGTSANDLDPPPFPGLRTRTSPTALEPPTGS